MFPKTSFNDLYEAYKLQDIRSSGIWRYVAEYLVPVISRKRSGLISKGRIAQVKPLKMRPTCFLDITGTKCAVTKKRRIPEERILDPHRQAKQKLAQTRRPETFEQDAVLSEEINAYCSLKYCDCSTYFHFSVLKSLHLPSLICFISKSCNKLP
jgi:hypothetical protein